MRLSVPLFLFGTLFISTHAGAHAVDGISHGVMFFHWHLGERVLGLSAPMATALALVGAVAMLAVAIRTKRRNAPRPVVASASTAAALLVIAGAGLLAGSV
jgi:hypothetical protein